MAADASESTDADTMVRSTVRITQAQQDAIRREVDLGRYPNESEAIRNALTETYLKNGEASHYPTKPAGDSEVDD